jgi:predicted nucleotidyltransferase
MQSATGLEQRIGAEAAAYVEELTRRTRAHLGDRLVGVWLFGSGALGDFALERSDIDVQAVSTGRVPRSGLNELASVLSHDALPCPARKLEFVLYAHEDLDQPAGPAFSLNLNTGEGSGDHVALDPREDPRFWFVVDVAIGRERGQSLFGPSPRWVFPELPSGLVIGALREALDWYGEQGDSPVEAVLGACRSWAFAADGGWRSKADSARWARLRLPDPGPVDRALRLRDGADERQLTAQEVATVTDAARVALEEAARQG